MRRRERIKRALKKTLHRVEAWLARAPWKARPTTTSMDTVSAAPGPKTPDAPDPEVIPQHDPGPDPRPAEAPVEEPPGEPEPLPIPDQDPTPQPEPTPYEEPQPSEAPDGIPQPEAPTFAGRSAAYDGPVPDPKGLPQGAVAQPDPWESVAAAPKAHPPVAAPRSTPEEALAHAEAPAPAPQSAHNAPPSDDAALDDEAQDLIVQKIVAELETIYDPEIPVNIYALGLIYAIKVHPQGGKVDIDMTLTSPNCPSAQELPAEVKEKAERVVGSGKVAVDIVWEPTWGPEKMSEAARLELNIW
jgi:FeS assembly SUF system protein